MSAELAVINQVQNNQVVLETSAGSDISKGDLLNIHGGKAYRQRTGIGELQCEWATGTDDQRAFTFAQTGFFQGSNKNYIFSSFDRGGVDRVAMFKVPSVGGQKLEFVAESVAIEDSAYTSAYTIVNDVIIAATSTGTGTVSIRKISVDYDTETLGDVEVVGNATLTSAATGSITITNECGHDCAYYGNSTTYGVFIKVVDYNTITIGAQVVVDTGHIGSFIAFDPVTKLAATHEDDDVAVYSYDTDALTWTEIRDNTAIGSNDFLSGKDFFYNGHYYAVAGSKGVGSIWLRKFSVDPVTGVLTLVTSLDFPPLNLINAGFDTFSFSYLYDGKIYFITEPEFHTELEAVSSQIFIVDAESMTVDSFASPFFRTDTSAQGAAITPFFISDGLMYSYCYGASATSSIEEHNTFSVCSLADIRKDCFYGYALSDAVQGETVKFYPTAKPMSGVMQTSHINFDSANERIRIGNMNLAKTNVISASTGSDEAGLLITSQNVVKTQVWSAAIVAKFTIEENY